MKVLAMVLAGGEGTRLRPLTHDVPKPALTLDKGLRIIDFVLSNLVNSGISSIYVLLQYKPQAVIAHLARHWLAPAHVPNGFITAILPKRHTGGDFTGTANAVYQNLDLIERHGPDLVAVFAADHVYRMDVRQMVRFHEERNAQVTVAALPVPIQKASAFGILSTGASGRLTEFQEKPCTPAPIPSDPGRAYASMGNYLFERAVLTTLLDQAHRRGDVDFGMHILPRLPRTHRIFAYDFLTNRVPGVEPHEEPGYWRDIGTLEAFEAARQEVAGSRPRFNLFNSHWPVRRDVRDMRSNADDAAAAAFGVAATQFDRNEVV
ncbi:MAG TPA: sugar phosphate nucleotidyltransferase [Burkholderiaceae bacterium]|nr:sugar phosphate nucleotidyltransferase [Burkholderiaceae bacterium]